MLRWLIAFVVLVGLAAFAWWQSLAPGQPFIDLADQTAMLIMAGVVIWLGILAFILGPVAPWLLALVGVGIVVTIAYQLVQDPGSVAIDWKGVSVTTSVAVSLTILLVLMVLTAILYRFWLAFVHGPGRVGRGFRDRRRRRGLQSLSKGLVAIAAGDAETAQRQADRAGELLNDPPLSNLLSAQVAQLRGDEKAAERYFAALAEEPTTSFLGLRGLLTQAMKQGDNDRALALARRAYRINPKSAWLVSTLYDLQKRAGKWGDAERTLDEAVRLRLIPASEANPQRSGIRYARSLAAGGDEAIRWAEKAFRADPTNIEAAARWAELLIDGGRHGKAVGVIESAWERAPTPDLADLYGRARKVSDPGSRLDAARRLGQHRPNDPESRLTVAAAAIGARAWNEARINLEPLTQGTPSPRVCRLMAELEEGQHNNTTAARTWLLRATASEPGAHTPPPAEPATAAKDGAASTGKDTNQGPGGGSGAGPISDGDGAAPAEDTKGTKGPVLEAATG